MEEKQINEVFDWSALERIAPPDKWMNMYEHYQELLTQEDVASFWHEQYLIANKERNELKEQLTKQS